jgi:hypothetical protein
MRVRVKEVLPAHLFRFRFDLELSHAEITIPVAVIMATRTASDMVLSLKELSEHCLPAKEA